MLILRPLLLSQWLHTEEIASCLHAPVTRAQSSAAAAGPWQPVGSAQTATRLQIYNTQMSCSVCVPLPATSPSELLTWYDSYYHASDRMTEDIQPITYGRAESASESILGAKKKCNCLFTTHWYPYAKRITCSLYPSPFLPSFFILKFERCCILYKRQTTTVVNHD